MTSNPLPSGGLRGDRGRVNLHDWIDELCDALDIEIDLDEALVLDLAKDAAHNVERPAAPITTFLLGYAAARSQGDPDEVERLASVASDLAQRWDKAADALDDDEDVEVDESVELDEDLESADA